MYSTYCNDGFYDLRGLTRGYLESPILQMTSNPEQIGRLQVVIPLDELKAIEDFRFRHRMPNRTAAVRELIRRGLAASEKQTSAPKKE
jgi:hypothetical protein